MSPTQWQPGRKPYVSATQEQILAYLRERGWSKMYTISKDLGVHRLDVLGSLQRLEVKEMVDVAMLARVKHWAPTGTPRPAGMMALDRGAPSLYDTNLRGRITDLLKKDPWLPMRLIEKRLGAFGTAKAVEFRLLRMAQSGEVRRILVDSPRRRLHLYGLPRMHSPGPERIRIILKEYGKDTPFWKGKENVTAYLCKHPWRTARQIYEDAGLKPGLVYNVLMALETDKKVQRLRVRFEPDGRRRPPDFVWALAGAATPRDLPIIEGEIMPGSMRSAVILLLKELGNPTAGELVAANNAKAGKKLAYGYACKILGDLEEVGLVERTKMGRDAGRYRLSSSIDAEIVREAEAHVDAMRRSAAKLRGLGYDVSLDIRRKECEE